MERRVIYLSVLLGVLASLCSGFGGDVLAVCGFGGDACGGDVTVGRVLLERLCGGGLGMGWIATAIGAGLSVLSSLYGGAKARQQAKEADREMAASRAKNDNWFRRRYNENYADTSAGQNLLRKAQEFGRDYWRKARGQQRVSGATDAQAALAKQQGLTMQGNTISQIAANDTSRKQAADTSHRQRDAQLSTQYIQNQQKKAAQTQYAAGQASNALMQAGAVIDTAGAGSAARAAGAKLPKGASAPYGATASDAFAMDASGNPIMGGDGKPMMNLDDQGTLDYINSHQVMDDFWKDLQ